MLRVGAFAALLAAVAAPTARAQQPMVQLGSTTNPGTGDYTAGIIQANGVYSYTTCSWSPACVAKYKNNPGAAAPTYLGQLDMPTNNDDAGPIFFTDASEAYAAFTFNLNSGNIGVAKAALNPGSDALPTLTNVADLGSSYGLVGSAAAFGNYMYIGSRNGDVLKVDMGSGATQASFVSASNNIGVSLSGGAVINGPLNKVYFGTGSPGTIYKFDTSAPGPNSDSNLVLSGALRAAAIDVTNDIAYWCASGSPGVIYKIALNSATTAAPTVIGSPLTLGAGENDARSIVLDLVNGYGYVGTKSGYVVRIILGGPTAAPTWESSLLLNPAIEAYVSLFDQATGLLYVAEYNNDPSTYFKIATRGIPPTPPTPGGGATLTATGPKHPVARGGKAALRFTLAGPALNKTKAGVVPKVPKRELAPKKYNTTYYAVSLAVPAGATVLRASTPLSAGKGNKAVINATQVYWPRVPLKEGLPHPQKINLRVTAKIAKTATGPLLFNATATNLVTGSTITAVPTPLAVQLK